MYEIPFGRRRIFDLFGRSLLLISVPSGALWLLRPPLFCGGRLFWRLPLPRFSDEMLLLRCWLPPPLFCDERWFGPLPLSRLWDELLLLRCWLPPPTFWEERWWWRLNVTRFWPPLLQAFWNGPPLFVWLASSPPFCKELFVILAVLTAGFWPLQPLWFSVELTPQSWPPPPPSFSKDERLLLPLAKLWSSRSAKENNYLYNWYIHSDYLYLDSWTDFDFKNVPSFPHYRAEQVSETETGTIEGFAQMMEHEEIHLHRHRHCRCLLRVSISFFFLKQKSQEQQVLPLMMWLYVAGGDFSWGTSRQLPWWMTNCLSLVSVHVVV